MDRNAYISLRAWHLSTSIPNPRLERTLRFSMMSLLDLGQYMTSFFNSRVERPSHPHQDALHISVFKELQ